MHCLLNKLQRGMHEACQKRGRLRVRDRGAYAEGTAASAAFLNLAHVQAHRHVPCPTCRQKAQVGDIAYVDAGRPAAKEAGSAGAAQREEEEKIFVRGSYSTKVCIPSLPITGRAALLVTLQLLHSIS